MKAGLVADLAPFYKAWGISIEDFAPGGVDRFTLEDGPKQGVFGVGDFLAGNIMVYNKDLFDQAGADYPPVDRSLEWPEYAELCRQVAQPNSDPTKSGVRWDCCRTGDSASRRSGSSAPTAGRRFGNMNSEEISRRGTSAPRSCATRSRQRPDHLDTVTEPDLFTQKGIAMTWTDFTFVRGLPGRGHRLRDRAVAGSKRLRVVRGHLDGGLGHVRRIQEPARGADVPAVHGDRRAAHPGRGDGRPTALAQGRRGRSTGGRGTRSRRSI